MVHFDRLMSCCLIKMWNENIHLFRAAGVHHPFLPCQNHIGIIVKLPACIISLVPCMEPGNLRTFLSDNPDFILLHRPLLNFLEVKQVVMR